MGDSKCIEEIAREIGSLTDRQIGDLALKEVLSSNGVQSSDYEVEISRCTDNVNFTVFKREIDYYFE